MYRRKRRATPKFRAHPPRPASAAADKGEPTLRRLEIIIAAIGAVIAAATIYTSYLQYQAGQRQADIAEAAFSPQLSMVRKVVAKKDANAVEQFQLLNDGSPIANVEFSYQHFFRLTSDTIQDEETRRDAVLHVPGFGTIHSSVLLNGQSRGEIAMTNNRIDQQNYSSLRKALIRQAEDYYVMGAVKAQAMAVVSIKYDTLLDRNMVAHFELSLADGQVRRLTSSRIPGGDPTGYSMALKTYRELIEADPDTKMSQKVADKIAHRYFEPMFERVGRSYSGGRPQD